MERGDTLCCTVCSPSVRRALFPNFGAAEAQTSTFLFSSIFHLSIYLFSIWLYFNFPTFLDIYCYFLLLWRWRWLPSSLLLLLDQNDFSTLTAEEKRGSIMTIVADKWVCLHCLWLIIVTAAASVVLFTQAVAVSLFPSAQNSVTVQCNSIEPSLPLPGR